MPLFRKQSAAEQTSLAPHDSKARLLSGRDSQGFMAKPCTPHLIPQAAQLFELQSRNVGVEGDSPRLSLGDSKGVFSSEREYPLWCRGAHAAPPPALARETPSSVGQIKKVQLFLKNPLDKWAPRAIMQPTSEELQTYDGEK